MSFQGMVLHPLSTKMEVMIGILDMPGVGDVAEVAISEAVVGEGMVALRWILSMKQEVIIKMHLFRAEVDISSLLFLVSQYD